MMHKCLLLLVVTLAFLSSGDALSPPTVGSKLSKLASLDMDQATHTNVDGKRLLRANGEEEDNSANEERGVSGATEKFKAWTQSSVKWARNSKLGQMLAKQFQKVIQYRRDWKVSGLIKKGYSDMVLLQNKVTPDEFFKAKGLSANLKDQASKSALWEKNPGLREYFSYKTFWDGKQLL
ncbi:RxLR effector protein 207 [Phytophthora ramorum]|uniref:RxLR effector protein 207 n=1 Tax=Phytophthora ramorum TaxID=164328 RepID=UPI0030B04760|nr:RxLR effector protein 207 [Phytophthora ramorum]